MDPSWVCSTLATLSGEAPSTPGWWHCCSLLEQKYEKVAFEKPERKERYDTMLECTGKNHWEIVTRVRQSRRYEETPSECEHDSVRVIGGSGWQVWCLKNCEQATQSQRQWQVGLGGWEQGWVRVILGRYNVLVLTGASHPHDNSIFCLLDDFFGTPIAFHSEEYFLQRGGNEKAMTHGTIHLDD